jgi:hypothetical protein
MNIFGHKKQKYRKIGAVRDELHNVYASLNIIGLVK